MGNGGKRKDAEKHREKKDRGDIIPHIFFLSVIFASLQ
jgi:hypothetical protein